MKVFFTGRSWWLGSTVTFLLVTKISSEKLFAYLIQSDYLQNPLGRSFSFTSVSKRNIMLKKMHGCASVFQPFFTPAVLRPRTLSLTPTPTHNDDSHIISTSRIPLTTGTNQQRHYWHCWWNGNLLCIRDLLVFYWCSFCWGGCYGVFRKNPNRTLQPRMK